MITLRRWWRTRHRVPVSQPGEQAGGTAVEMPPAPAPSALPVDPPAPEPPALALPTAEAGSQRYLQGTESLRSTAKWLLAAFAAIGAALLAGLQLTAVGELGTEQMPRLIGAIAGFILGLISVVYMIFQTTKILTNSWVTLSELSNEKLDNKLQPTRASKDRKALLQTLQEQIDLNRQELFAHVAETIPDLHSTLRAANRAARGFADSTPEPSNSKLWSVARAAMVQNVANQVTDFANYNRTRIIFGNLIPRLAVAAAVVAIATGVFAYSVNPPTGPSVTEVHLVNEPAVQTTP